MAPTLEKTISDCQSVKQAAAAADRIDSKQVAPSGGFQRMLSELERAFNRSRSSVDVDEVWRILEEYQSQASEWARFAYYDMSKYKRNLVAEYDKYNVMIICWGPGSRSCIHDHAGSHCFMKVLDGELIEGRFAWPDKRALAGVKSEEMMRIMDTRMRLNDVVYIHGELCAQICCCCCCCSSVRLA